jgi:CRISPR-associated protein Cas2
MLEIAPGVYVEPDMKTSVRDNIWETMLAWDDLMPDDAGVVLFWRHPEAPSGLGMRLLGWPKKELVDHEGVWLAARNLTEQHDTDELDLLADVDHRPHDPDDTAAEHLRLDPADPTDD